MVHADFDAEDETGVFLDGLDRLVHVYDAHVVEAAAQHAIGGQTHGSDVQKGQQPGAVRRKHVVAHRSVVEKTGRAGINTGGHAAAEAGLVGVDGGAAAAVVEVTVQIDEARGD